MSPQPDSETAAAARVGRTLCGRWHLDALIDVGGMAAVYAATDRDGTRGAVKVLHREVSLHPEAASRFLREGFIASRVAHPQALRVLDDDVDDDGTMFLVMELLEGATLHRCAQAAGGTLAPKEALLILDQLLDVLAAVHRAGIIHRDIKPENVFLTTDGEVKLLDFGIARMGEPVTTALPTANAPERGVVMGSPVYMSPEQASGRWDLVDEQSDVWSVGATMFTLLSGEPIHGATVLPELLTAISMLPARSLGTVRPRPPPAVVDVVDRALQRERGARWPDALTMQAAVRAAHLTVFGVPLPGAVVKARDSGAKGGVAPGRWAASSRPSPSARGYFAPPMSRDRAGWFVAGALALGAVATVGSVRRPLRSAGEAIETWRAAPVAPLALDPSQADRVASVSAHGPGE